MRFVDSIKQDNGDATHRISTAHVSSNGNIYVTGIQEDTCNNNTCNRNGDLYDKNIKSSNACIPVNIYNSDV